MSLACTSSDPPDPPRFTGNKEIDTAIHSLDGEEEKVKRILLSKPIEQPGEVNIYILHGNDQPYNEIRNLVWGKNDPVYRVALEEWNQKELILRSRVERREKASADLINQIFNLVGFYSVYQGVVLTAVSQLKSSSDPQCGKVWFPILLTVVGAVITISGVGLKFVELSGLEESITSEKQAQAGILSRLETFRRLGPNFRFFEEIKDSRTENPKSFWKKKSGVFVALVVVTVCFILSYFVIFCDW